jgi:hypothetical protein
MMLAHIKRSPTQSATPMTDALTAMYADSQQFFTAFDWRLLRAQEQHELQTYSQEQKAQLLLEHLKEKHAERVKTGWTPQTEGVPLAQCAFLIVYHGPVSD